MKIAYTIITQDDKTALVEFAQDERAKRVVIPVSEIKKENEGQLDESVLNAGIPYGLPFEDIIELAPNFKQSIADELHNRGIWTAEDMRTFALVVHQAVMRAAGVEASRIIQLVLDYQPAKKSTPKPKPTTKKESD